MFLTVELKEPQNSTLSGANFPVELPRISTCLRRVENPGYSDLLRGRAATGWTRQPLVRGVVETPLAHRQGICDWFLGLCRSYMSVQFVSSIS